MIGRLAVRAAAGWLSGLLVFSPCASAQRVPKPVMENPIPDEAVAPVNVGASLYVGCVRATFEFMDPRMAKSEIEPFITQLDENCLTWAVLWYGPIMSKRDDPVNMQDWDGDQVARFNYIRLGVQKELRDTLKKYMTK